MRTRVNTVRQGFLDQTTASGAYLTSVARIDQHHTASSVLSFLHRVDYQLSPRSVRNALGKAMVLDHILDAQVLETNHVVFIDKLTAQLMTKISSSISNTLVNVGHNPPPSGALRRALFGLTQTALGLSKGFLFFAKEARIGNLFTIGEHSEGCQSQVNPNVSACSGQGFGLDLSGEAGEPLIRRVAPDDHLLNLALNGPMESDLDVSNLGKVEFPLIGDAESELGVRDAMVAALAFKTRIARRFAIFDAVEETLKSFIHATLNILKHLRVDNAERGAFPLPPWEKLAGAVVIDRLLPFLPSITTIGKRLIVDPATLFKHLLKNCLLGLSRIKAIAIGFKHSDPIVV